ncbi:MAG: hypothetical protein E6556_14320 [Pantoea sp.]|nr:hypothetical protein [Pantoea sp.]
MMISLMRYGVKRVLLSQEMPRKGLMLSEEVAVIKQNNLNPESVSAEAEEASAPDGAAMTGSSLPDDNQQTLLHASETEKNNSQSWLLKVKARYGGVIIAAIVCALFVAVYLSL